MGDLASTLSTAADVVNDPYFDEMICHIQQLKALNQGQTPPVCAATPEMAGGVGIGKLMPAMRYYVYAQENPWVWPAAIATVVGLPFLLGYMFGQDSRRGGAP